MPGKAPSRDLAVMDPWEASYARSRARRERAGAGRSPSGRGRRFGTTGVPSPSSLSALLDGRGRGPTARDLTEAEPWDLSLGRSRARRRAEELRFVPAGTRAKRISLGALVALAAGPSASLAEASGAGGPAAGPATTTEHSIVLSPGSEGRQVQLLQQALGNVTVDGVYGPATEEAVQRFQASRGLTVDGIVGPLTSAALRGQAPARASVADVSGLVETSSASGEEGSGGDAVARLQSALHVTADGNFGPETEAAIRRLQARHGLTVDGIVGPATWNVIGVSGEETLTPPTSAIVHSEHHSSSANGDAGADPGAGEASSTAGTAGAGGNTVAQLQSALHLTADGTFGPETEAAVKRLQARHGLTVDGVVGPATWSLIGVSDGQTLNPPRSALDGAGQGGGGSSNTAGGGEGGSSVVARVIAAGDEIATRPYVFGGGHGSFQSTGYDCSGSVSYALHGGGLLTSPEDSSALESYGEAGPGKYITIYANAEHAWMVVDGKRFDTIAQQETGTRWSDSMMSTAGYVARHPDGM